MKLKYFVNLADETNIDITFSNGVTNVKDANVMEFIHLNDHPRVVIEFY